MRKFQVGDKVRSTVNCPSFASVAPSDLCTVTSLWAHKCFVYTVGEGCALRTWVGNEEDFVRAGASSSARTLPDINQTVGCA